MLKTFVSTSLIWLAITAQAGAAEKVGFRDTTLDPSGARPLHVAFWYPTEDTQAGEPIGENKVFHGIQAIRDAAPTATARPLVVLSHGYGGNWRNLNWLAEILIQQGYVVAAPDHPGTTSRDRDPARAAMLWERPRDLSRVIDALTTRPELAGPLDATRIAAIGHSLGGWTVMALAGGRFDAQRFKADCQENTSPRACALAPELGLADPTLEKDMADPRIRAFVSLDLGLARGFSPESLSQIDSPALILSAGTDIDGLPSKLESGYLSAHLPKASTTSVEIPEAMHFSFMQLCKPEAVAIIEAETPGDGIVCKNGGERRREAIHLEIAALVSGFLTEALAPKP